MSCTLCSTETKDKVCKLCKELTDSTKEYTKLNSALRNCPICHTTTTNTYLKSHGLCSNCYRKKGGRPNAPPSPTGREIFKYMKDAIDIYEKVPQPKRFILQDITTMYFNIMGTPEPVVKKLERLSIEIDSYLVKAIREINLSDDLKNPNASQNQT